MQPRLVVTVECLACRRAYAKPEGRGTARTNPGCPDCGYVGWAPAGELNGARAPRRSGEDPRRLLRGR